MAKESLVILTGAGISAESGLKTFRDGDGLWESHRIEDVATPEAYHYQPELVHQFYNFRRAELKKVKPNAAHFALAKLESVWQGPFLIITQNVDDLHERAGSQKLIHMHGELFQARCTSCYAILRWEDDIFVDTRCPCCNTSGSLRPNIVWFGESPFRMKESLIALGECDYFVSIGTSGNVFPAADFVRLAENTCPTLEINKERTIASPLFNENIFGEATKVVPVWAEAMCRTHGIKCSFDDLTSI